MNYAPSYGRCAHDAHARRPTMSPTTHFEPALVRIEPACRYLGVGRSKLYELIREGKLEAVKIGKSARITTASLKRLSGVCRRASGVHRSSARSAVWKGWDSTSQIRPSANDQNRKRCAFPSSRSSACSRRQGPRERVYVRGAAR